MGYSLTYQALVKEVYRLKMLNSGSRMLVTEWFSIVIILDLFISSLSLTISNFANGMIRLMVWLQIFAANYLSQAYEIVI